MSNGTRLRLNVNYQAITRTASLISNSVILTANAYLLTSGVINNLRERKRERIHNTMELGAQVANAVAGLSKVIVETLDRGKSD